MDEEKVGWVDCICCGTSYNEEVDNGAWGGMCIDCSNEHFICDRCGTVYLNNEYGEDGYCINCSRQGSPYIHEYHHDFEPCFHPDRTEPIYFGVELETEDYDDLETAAEALAVLSEEEHLFWQEEDSSLENGVEIITQPCSLDFHRDFFPWKEIKEIVRQYGGSSERTAHSALHIHFSRSFYEGKHLELYELRLIYLFEKFYNQLAILGRMSRYLLERSAVSYKKKLPHLGSNLFDKSAQRKINELSYYSSRYMAVNLRSSQPTIEIRLFRGTLSRNVILASIELVDFLARYAKNTTTTKLQGMTWTQLVQKMMKSRYKYLPQYLEEKKAGELTNLTPIFEGDKND